jgi:hypothetical protein
MGVCHGEEEVGNPSVVLPTTAGLKCQTGSDSTVVSTPAAGKEFMSGRSAADYASRGLWEADCFSGRGQLQALLPLERTPLSHVGTWQQHTKKRVLAELPAIRGWLSAIQDVLFAIIANHGASLSSDLPSLRHYFQYGGDGPQGVYGALHTQYAAKYMLASIYKASVLLDELDDIAILRQMNHIVDVGSGPGSFVLAYAMKKAAQPSQCAADTVVTMLDAVPQFHDLFLQIWQALPPALTHGITVRPIQAFLNGKIRQYARSADLIVFCNSLVELSRNPEVQVPDLIKDCVDLKAPIAAIDYDYDTSVKYLVDFADMLSGNYVRIRPMRWPLVYQGYELVDLGRFDNALWKAAPFADYRSSNLHFVKSLWLPLNTTNEYRNVIPLAIVQDYQRAWETHDIGLLQSLFTEDAVYREREDREPFVGIGSISDYWRINATQQRHVRFFPREIEYSGNTVRVKWECSFLRQDLDRWMRLKGAFEAELHKGLIHHFSETFEKEIAGSGACDRPWRIDCGCKVPPPQDAFSLQQFGDMVQFPTCPSVF